MFSTPVALNCRVKPTAAGRRIDAVTIPKPSELRIESM
jgi:hypothetical protein